MRLTRLEPLYLVSSQNPAAITAELLTEQQQQNPELIITGKKLQVLGLTT